MVKVLVVEDEASIREMIALNLRLAGMEAVEADSAEAALPLLEQKPSCDAAILDVMLPGMNGFSLCETIRRTDQKIGIIILSAKGQEQDKIRGLSIGADDYMTKPFSVLELLARVRSLLRRTKEEEPEQPKLFDCGALHLDLETREVKVNGREVLLTYKEYELLVYLAENQNRVVSRDELLDKLWDWRADVETRTLDIHIKTLRQKLGEEAGHYIKTVRSVGYRFMKPQE